MITPEQQAVSKVLYDYMLAAHAEQFGAASIQMRHYLRGLAEQLVERLGMSRQLCAQPEDMKDWFRAGAVEERWDHERRTNRVGPVRKWRELQVILTAPLPTEKGWR